VSIFSEREVLELLLQRERLGGGAADLPFIEGRMGDLIGKTCNIGDQNLEGDSQTTVSGQGGLGQTDS